MNHMPFVFIFWRKTWGLERVEGINCVLGLYVMNDRKPNSHLRGKKKKKRIPLHDERTRAAILSSGKA